MPRFVFPKSLGEQSSHHIASFIREQKPDDYGSSTAVCDIQLHQIYSKKLFNFSSPLHLFYYSVSLVDKFYSVRHWKNFHGGAGWHL